MILNVIASGSSGNSYLLRNDKECLIIEMGMPFMEVKKALDFNIRPIVGGVSSHEHGDHFKYYAEYEKAGIKTYKPWIDQGLAWVQYGGFKIQEFMLPHGDISSHGFYIRHEEIGQLLFLTDFEYSKYDFSKLNVEHILIECNYDLQYIDVDTPNFKHKVQGHCSLDTCKQFVRHNNSPHLRTVCLIHSNPMTLDETDAIRQIKGIVDADVNVVIAEPGLEIKLNKEWLDD